MLPALPVGRGLVELKRYKKSKLLVAMAIDRVARRIFRFGRVFARRPKFDLTRPARRDKILVVQAGAVGDLVMSLPALRTLRARFPRSRITLVAGPWAHAILAEERDVITEIVALRAPWLSGSSLGDRRRFWYGALKLRRARYDLGLDLRGDPRSLLFLYLTAAVERVSYGWHGVQLGEYLLTQVVPGPAPNAHLVDRFLAIVTALGCEPESRTPRIRVAHREHLAARVWRQGVLARTGGRVLVGIHPGAANPLRHWSSQRFAALITRLVSLLEVNVVVFAGPGEEAIATEIVQLANGAAVVEQAPLRDFIIRVSALDALVALDSSPAHIGAALDVPVIALFGPALPEFVGPIGTSVRIVQQGPFECRPCTQERCVHPEASCMDAISVDAVFRATSEILSIRRRTEERVVRP